MRYVRERYRCAHAAILQHATHSISQPLQHHLFTRTHATRGVRPPKRSAVMPHAAHAAPLHASCSMTRCCHAAAPCQEMEETPGTPGPTGTDRDRPRPISSAHPPGQTASSARHTHHAPCRPQGMQTPPIAKHLSQRPNLSTGGPQGEEPSAGECRSAGGPTRRRESPRALRLQQQPPTRPHSLTPTLAHGCFRNLPTSGTPTPSSQSQHRQPTLRGALSRTCRCCSRRAACAARARYPPPAPAAARPSRRTAP